MSDISALWNQINAIHAELQDLRSAVKGSNRNAARILDRAAERRREAERQAEELPMDEASQARRFAMRAIQESERRGQGIPKAWRRGEDPGW